MPHLDELGQNDGGEANGQEGEEGLVDEQHLAPVEAVGQHAGEGRHEQGDGAQAEHDGDLEGGAAEVEGEPSEGDLLDPVAAADEEGAHPEQAEVAMAQGAEGAPPLRARPSAIIEGSGRARVLLHKGSGQFRAKRLDGSTRWGRGGRGGALLGAARVDAGARSHILWACAAP